MFISLLSSVCYFFWRRCNSVYLQKGDVFCLYWSLIVSRLKLLFRFVALLWYGQIWSALPPLCYLLVQIIYPLLLQAGSTRSSRPWRLVTARWRRLITCVGEGDGWGVVSWLTRRRRRWAMFCIVLLYYVAVGCVLFCYVMLCYVVLWYDMICYNVLWCDVMCCTVLCCVMLQWLAFGYVLFVGVVLFYFVMLLYLVSFLWCIVLCCCIMLCYVAVGCVVLCVCVCCVILFCHAALPCFVLLRCVVLCCDVLCCAVWCGTKLFYVEMLGCVVMCCIVMSCVMLCCVVLSGA